MLQTIKLTATKREYREQKTIDLDKPLDQQLQSDKPKLALPPNGKATHYMILV